MIVFHATTEQAAQAILVEGFRDGQGSYGFIGIEFRGVWVSNQPVDVNEGAKGDVLISIELTADESELTIFQVDELGWRSWCLPAKFLNAGRIALVIDRTDIADMSELERRRARELHRRLSLAG